MANIEVLKKDILVVAKLANGISKALEDDGKISGAEGIGLAFKAIDLIGVIKSINSAKDELMDLDVAEAKELVDLFRNEFDISNDKAEMIVEEVVDLAIQLCLTLEVIGS